MKEYIVIPQYFNKELVESKILNSFLKDAKYIDKTKIKLQSLREFYRRDTQNGLKLIEELKLRGFEFILTSPSKFLYTFKNNKKIELLYTSENSNKIEKINKKIFSFLDYENSIKSDFYFNLVPIYAFKNVMKNFNYDLVKQEFIRYGYKVVSEEYLNKSILGSNNTQYISKCHGTKEVDIILPDINYKLGISSIINSIINKNPEYKNSILNIELDNILPDRLLSEKLIRNKLFMDKIYTINELVDYNINRLNNINGVGTKRILEFKHSIIEGIVNINKDNCEKYNVKYDSDLNSYIKYLIEENYEYKNILQNIKLNKVLLNMSNITKTDERILTKFKDDGIIYIYDLIDYDIKRIKDLKGVGEKKFNNITTFILEELKVIKLKFEEISKDVFLLDDSRFKRFRSYKIKELHRVLYGDKIEEYADLNEMYISDLQGIEYSYFDDYNKVFYLNKILVDLNEVTDINKILRNSLPSNISKRNKKIIKLRIIEGKTLEEVGKLVGLTRERIRQIEKKILDICFLNLKKYKFFFFLELNFNSSEFFYIKDLIDLLDKENYFIVNMIVSGNIDKLYYYEPLERVYLEPKDNFDSDLKEIVEIIPNYGETEEDLGFILELLDELFLDISYGEGIKILEKNDVYIRDIYYFKGNLNNKTMIEIIFKYIHRSELTLDDKGVKIINKYINNIFEKEINNNARNWQGVISRIDEIILVNPKTYVHIDHIPVDTEVIKSLKYILDEELTESNYIYSERLLERVNLEHPNNNIISKHHIYSLIKYYYSEYYQTSSGNSLQISKIGTPRLTNSEYIYNICLKKGGVISLDKIQKITKWSNHIIEMAISNNDKMVKLGGQKCGIVKLLFKNDELSLFKQNLKDDMKEGYTTSSKFYYKLLFDENMSIFLNRNKIKNGKELVGLMKYFDKNIYGHNVFIYYKNSNIKNIEDVIYSLYPKRVYRNEIYEILVDFKIENTSIVSIVDRLLSSKRYVQVSREEYINYNDFEIDESVKEKLLSYFDEIYENDGFIVPEDHINKIKFLLSYNSFTWNQYTISTILVENRYRKLTRFNSDYRYEILVLVREDSKYKDISYLMYDLIKNEYRGNLHEEHVYGFLSEKGIYRIEEERSKKKLEMDAKKNELLTVDVVGNIRLKE